MTALTEKPLFHPVFLIPSGSYLTFPEYRPNANSQDPRFILDATRQKALYDIALILQKREAFGFELFLDELRREPRRYLSEHMPPSLATMDNYAQYINNLSDDEALEVIRENSPTMTPDFPLIVAPNEEATAGHAKEVYGSFTFDMKVLDLLHTETLLYLTSTYSREPGNNYYDSLQSVIPPMPNMERLISDGVDVDTEIKNLSAYRRNEIPLWQRRVFDDVRLGDTALNRPDLYNLTGEDHQWASRIIEISIRSRSIWNQKVRSGATDREAAKEELKRTRNRPHITKELAALLREGDEWTGRVKSFMELRNLTGTEVAPELVRSVYLEGSLSLNNGML